MGLAEGRREVSVRERQGKGKGLELIFLRIFNMIVCSEAGGLIYVGLAFYRTSMLCNRN